jgi:hypothetical protein
MTENEPADAAAKLAATRARAADLLSRATEPTRWHWSGNTDTGEPYLATWVPGAGRCQVLAIGTEDRSTTGRAADRVRSDAREFDLGDPEELVHDWATDQFGEPVADPRLEFVTGLMCVHARDLVVYEVAPNATHRDDPAVYRADVVGIRHPDAELIAEAPKLLAELLPEEDRFAAQLADARAELAALKDRS